MQRTQFSYELPQGLIAQHPLPERSQSRLMVLDGQIQHQVFTDLPNLLSPDDLLIFNNTKVIPARLFAQKSTGGAVEILIERLTSTHRAQAMLRASKSPKEGARLQLENGAEIKVTGREGDLFCLEFLGEQSLLEVLDDIGHIPLPPYINRNDAQTDRARYQTIYAQHPGANAAPTAGLHFDEALIKALNEKGVVCDYITLHVGVGTFQPVRVDDIREHKMHAETVEVSKSICEKIQSTKRRGGRVIAVGTTSVRALESASQTGALLPFSGNTDIFIYPGYEFKCVDAMVTNFHLPESTLLMLVCAFSGYDTIMKAYQEAIKQQYRFFSYGDAMLLL